MVGSAPTSVWGTLRTEGSGYTNYSPQLYCPPSSAQTAIDSSKLFRSLSTDSGLLTYTATPALLLSPMFLGTAGTRTPRLLPPIIVRCKMYLQCPSSLSVRFSFSCTELGFPCLPSKMLACTFTIQKFLFRLLTRHESRITPLFPLVNYNGVRVRLPFTSNCLVLSSTPIEVVRSWGAV